MKLSTSVFAALACLLLSTCDGLDDIEVTAEGQAVIPAGTVVDQLLGDFAVLGFEDMDITQEQEFENQGYTRDQIDRAVVVSLTLRATSPADANFDWLDSIAFSARAEGLPTIEIARLDPVPDGATELELEVLDVDLTPYVTAPSMTITTDATGRSPSEETTIDASIAVAVDVNVSGATCGG